jgi:Family of unknown function (DUF6152)
VKEEPRMRSIHPITPARVLVAAVCLLAGALSAAAHHSVSGVFDVTKEVTVTGKITMLEWINPHTYLHVDVQEPNGVVTTYVFESLPPAFLRRSGVNKEGLLGGKEVGTTVTVKANPYRDKPHGGWITRITYPDGHFYQLSPDTR